MQNKIKLYGAIILAMVFWSVSFIWTKVAILSFPPITLISLRLAIASILLFVVSLATGKFQKIKRKDLKWFILIAFFEPYLYFVGETYGLTLVSSTVASVIISTIPLFAPAFAFLILRERINKANILGIIISLIGVYFVLYEANDRISADMKGVILLFLAVFAGICFSITLRKIPLYYSTINVILYQSFIGLLLFIPTYLFTDFPFTREIIITRESLISLVLLAVFASVFAFVLFASSVRKLGVTKSNAFVNLIPVFTAVFSWIILDEVLTINKWIGISIVIVGLFISQLKETSFHKNQHNIRKQKQII